MYISYVNGSFDIFEDINKSIKFYCISLYIVYKNLITEEFSRRLCSFQFNCHVHLSAQYSCTTFNVRNRFMYIVGILHATTKEIFHGCNLNSTISLFINPSITSHILSQSVHNAYQTPIWYVQEYFLPFSAIFPAHYLQQGHSRRVRSRVRTWRIQCIFMGSEARVY